MRVIVWGINYAPEFTGIAPHSVALCEYLAGKGHEVEMVTSFAYYPNWRKRPEDRGKLYRTDRLNGVCVRRCWHFVPERVSAIKRIFHEASFVFTSTLRILTLPRPDVFVVVSPPLLLGAAGWFIRTVKRKPYIFHVQDMQPDAAVGLGMLKPNAFTRALYALEAFAYRHAARVSGITRGMLNGFAAKGVPETKLVYFPNAIELAAADQTPGRGEFRQRNNFRPDEFIAVYAGNLGVKQGLEVLLQTAPLLRDSRIRILICGDGAQREVLAARAREMELPNFSMLPLQQGRDYRALLVDADVCFITQQAGAGNSFFPSKLLGLLAESKTVVTVAAPECELALSLREGGFGENVAPGRPEELASLLDSLAQDPDRLAQYGAAGRRYVQQFEKTSVMEAFANTLKAVATVAQ
ncbi:MAG TPA: WcaI family glycosyltransferase [Chthoniobacterales bacterium]|jgi:colanic acid biosynthesis glycosyl transferase WcaI|nr:WcaI family glycosyltransferase [Chthoniobacterales bacterium]